MQLENSILTQLHAFFDSTPVRKVYLFGSFARGDAHVESDIDLLVELSSIPSRRRMFAYRRALEALTNRKVDLVREDLLLRYARAHIMEEAVLIFDRTQNV